MNKGFTLIELLATIFILSIIVTITVPIIKDKIDEFQEKNFENMVNNIEAVTENYINDNRDNLSNLNYFGFINVTIDTLVKEGYLEDSLINPLTQNPISLNDVVYVTLDYNNKVSFLYDPYQSEKDKITLNGIKNMRIKKDDTYTEYGAVAIDKNGNNVSSNITINGTVNTNVEGVYTINYFTGNSITITRYVIVSNDYQKEDIEPAILISNIQNNYIETKLDEPITMPVVTATDNVDGTIGPISPSFNNVDITTLGTYYIKYNYTDSSQNKSDTLVIKVVVTP